MNVSLIRSSKTFLARLCEQAERYDEMVTYMKEVAKVRFSRTRFLLAPIYIGGID